MPAELHFRAPWEAGRYAPWLRQLRGKSGVYVIRVRATAKQLYVGESHTGALYQTVTRHFQRWTSPTNVTFGRDQVEVAVIVTPDGEAVEAQNALICELGPEHNELTPGCEDAPKTGWARLLAGVLSFADELLPDKDLPF